MTTPTPAQLAAVGFAALAIGKVFEALDNAQQTISAEQQMQMTHVVGSWLRERYGDDVVESAKSQLGSAPESEDASDEEVNAAMEAARTCLERLFTVMKGLPDAVREDAEQALHAALVDAYSEEDIVLAEERSSQS